jgi:hypothetical protein
MKYTPINWHYSINEQGDKIYDDHRLNVVLTNLKTVHELISQVKSDSDVNLLYVQNNVGSHTILDPTVQTLGWIASKIVESLSMAFPAGTPSAVIATIFAKLLSGIVQGVTTNKETDQYNKILGKVNDIRDFMTQIFDFLKADLTEGIDDLQGHWNKVYECPGALLPDIKGKITLSELGDYDQFFPKNGSTDFDTLRDKLDTFCNYTFTQKLLPIKWKIKRQKAFPGDGISNLIKGWNTERYKVYNHNTWDRWRNSPNFPEIPSDLRDDIEGPFFDVGDEWDNGVNKQELFSWGEVFRYYPWSTYPGVNNDNKWTYWSGKHNPTYDENGNIKQGLSFLDALQDIKDGIFYGPGQWSLEDGFPNHPSYLCWYKVRNSVDRQEHVNDRRPTTLLDKNCAIDWVYDSNSIFTWGRAYRGITLNHYYLVDSDGGHASQELCDWLFKDDGFGNIVKSRAIAEKVDVYHNWGLPFYN